MRLRGTGKTCIYMHADSQLRTGQGVQSCSEAVSLIGLISDLAYLERMDSYWMN
jgi:hypothetical protein